jgi:hypothetical protein
MDVPARLEGGPFDGADTLIIDVVTPPRQIFAYLCPACGAVHADPSGDGTRYRFHSSDELGTRYRFGDPTFDSDEKDERILTPVEDDELVPA